MLSIALQARHLIQRTLCHISTKPFENSGQQQYYRETYINDNDSSYVVIVGPTHTSVHVIR